MRKMIGAIVVAGAAMALVPTEASAWYCRAHSPSAHGWATNYSLHYAKRNALHQCAIRTPRYETCYITTCR